ncbi:hypothetical protein [Pseudomonas sp. M30-35]|uniref:hypothetical protein n=1 Tax=Pseudomonas sp. M30-35 TaxID=1981174 RepID=UPI000B3C2BD3|nr:hypothetical protein [Pseudomonas sp. M30-35]ARU90098.1 hypothetical protein B9K09_20030 [Pseudomonas sp. M30-35]
MTITHRFLQIAAVAMLLGGCTSKPIYNAQENFSSNMGISENQMQRAIVTALHDRQWKIQSVKPGQIEAEITVRGRHHAEVDIPYSPTSFEIRYRSSWGLDYKNGEIHGNYNRWVNRLRDNVLKELSIDPNIEALNNLGAVKRDVESPSYFAFQEGVERATQAGLLDGSIQFYLSGQPVPGSAHHIRTVTSSRKTNGANKSDKDACIWALQSALVALQSAAKKAGANAVIDIASIDQRSLYKDANNYQCNAGTFMASVALRGELVTLK